MENMENSNPEAERAQGLGSAPVLADHDALMREEKPAFAASAQEQIAALVTYIAAHVFCRLALAGPWQEWEIGLIEGVAGVVFAALVELVNRGRPRMKESWVWLGCYAMALAGCALRRFAVWNEWQTAMFLGVFGGWWALSRSGMLLEGRSGRLLPLDALNIFLIFPCEHYFLRARTMRYALSRLSQSIRRRQKASVSAATLAWTAGAVVLAGALFVAAGVLLGAADDRFAGLMGQIRGFFHIQLKREALTALLISLPVGAYLFSLVAGPSREKRLDLCREVEGVDGLLRSLRHVPPALWTAVIALFSLMYAAFFALQAGYLFGAFTRTLPEGFIVSEYARQGFFELCAVTAVNFALLWLATRLASRESRAMKAACLVLLGESVLLGVVALSKLMLYIDCFGFTPLRLQSSWLVCALLAGCVCAAVSLVTGRKTFRAWMIIGAATLTALCLW